MNAVFITIIGYISSTSTTGRQLTTDRITVVGI